MGANITAGEDWIEVAGVKNANRKLNGITIDCTAIPDAAMTLAVAAMFAEGPTRLNGIASWRVKETDRIAAMATELKKVGATVEEGSDYIVIHLRHLDPTPSQSTIRIVLLKHSPLTSQSLRR
jgi:3-phosphoshikimate 1-carboxyvinyltransferase